MEIYVYIVESVLDGEIDQSVYVYKTIEEARKSLQEDYERDKNKINNQEDYTFEPLDGEQDMGASIYKSGYYTIDHIDYIIYQKEIEL